MDDGLARDRVHVYEYGESSGDLRTAFYVDERAYADPDLARTVLEIADAALTRLSVIYSVVVTSGDDARVPLGVPTWEAMSRAVEADHERFRDELIGMLDAAYPGGSVSVRADVGPLRRSSASID